jgi:hypothetical protein
MKQTALASALLAAFAIATPAFSADFGNANDFVGTWRNVRASGDLRRIQITSVTGIPDVSVHIYAKCTGGSGSTCDWDPVYGYYDGGGTMHATIHSTNAHGYVFADRDLILRLNSNGTMDYDMTTDFVMFGDPRPNHVPRGTMRR